MGETRTFSLVPTPGQGLITALSDYSIANFPQSYKSLRDVVIRDNAFQVMRTNTLNDLPVGQATPIWAIHYFNTSFPITYRMRHAGGDVSGGGTATLYGNFNNALLTTSGPHELCFLNIKDRCFIAGRTINSPKGPWVLDSDGATNYAWGRPGPAGELAYTPLGNFTNATTKQFYDSAAAITITNGSAFVTCNDASFDASGAWAGAQLTIFSSSTAVFSYTISTVTDASNLTLTTPVSDPTTANKPYLVNYGSLTWGVSPPQYSYSYYNPTTGHSTNGSPVTKISETNQVSVDVELLNIQGTNDPQYTHIILFRTDLGGGDRPKPLKLDPSHAGTATIEITAGLAQWLIKNDYVGTRTYVDALPDSERAKAVGNFVVPLDRNNPPPSDIKYTAYWNGQVFCTTASTPWRLYYSRQGSPEELGVGEESFPPSYYTDISSDNGYITGLRPVGDSLLVCTDRYLYFADGPPNNYKLVRVSARGAGVSHWAIDEHPGDSTSNTASAIYVGRDKRLWRHYPGGQIQDLGAPIQDKLDLVKVSGARPFHVRVCMVDRYQLLALGILNTNGTFYDFYFYDFDTNNWLDLGFSQNSALGGQPSWCIGTGLDFGTHLGAAAVGLAINNVLYNIMNGAVSAGTPGNPTANGETHFLDFGDWTAKKTLQGIIFYTSDTTADTSATDWKCFVRFDKSASAYLLLTRLPLSGTPRDLGPGTFFWDVKALGVKQWHAIQVAWFIGGAAISTLNKLHRVEIIYTLESTGASGKP
jgi:hypothetical protein